MLLMVLVFPKGIAGSVQALWHRVRGEHTTVSRGAA
jgi:hypothetical protein